MSLNSTMILRSPENFRNYTNYTAISMKLLLSKSPPNLSQLQHRQILSRSDLLGVINSSKVSMSKLIYQLSQNKNRACIQHIWRKSFGIPHRWSICTKGGEDIWAGPVLSGPLDEFFTPYIRMDTVSFIRTTLYSKKSFWYARTFFVERSARRHCKIGGW